MTNRQIVSQGKYYLYRHIRPDKDEPFYVGVGTKCEQDYKYDSYRRANTKYGKKKIWRYIVAKNNGIYSVDILIESNDYDFILQKEVEFIALYGRIDIKTGILANHTNGGEGVKGRVVSEETRRKISIGHTGKVYNEERRKLCRNNVRELSEQRRARISETQLARGNRGASNILSTEIYQYNINGEFVKKWNSQMDIKRALNIRTARISEACNRDNHFHCEYFWYYNYQGEKIIPPSTKNCMRKKVTI